MGDWNCDGVATVAVVRPGSGEVFVFDGWAATGADLDSDQQADDGLSLVFDSLPLAADLEILGAPVVELELAVDRPLALVVARLCDVDGHGASNRVTYGVLNLTHRDSDAEPVPLEPGRRYRIRLQLNDIAYAFAAGHRLRLALSTSYWPIVFPSPSPATVTVFVIDVSVPMFHVPNCDAGTAP